MSRSTILRAGVTVVVVALVAAVVGIAWPNSPQRRLTAYFTSTVGLYAGADVRVLGIRVGKVTKITPVGRSVRVEMTYDAKRKIPANAQAVIVNQSLVADRYVQLTPVYRGGALLADKVTLPLTRTVTPVEIDDISGSLNNLNTALGPNGANANGSLSRLLQVGSDTLNGQGDDIRATINDSAKVLSTLSEDRKDITANIENLRLITQALAVNDQQVRNFNGHLAQVSSQLAGEKEELGAALRALGPTLRNLARFVRGNRGQLAANVRQLAQITSVLVKEPAPVRQPGDVGLLAGLLGGHAAPAVRGAAGSDQPGGQGPGPTARRPVMDHRADDPLQPDPAATGRVRPERPAAVAAGRPGIEAETGRHRAGRPGLRSWGGRAAAGR